MMDWDLTALSLQTCSHTHIENQVSAHAYVMCKGNITGTVLPVR